MDSPYYIETSRNSDSNYAMEYHVFTSEGLVCKVYTFEYARMIVEALNRQALERAVARHT